MRARQYLALALFAALLAACCGKGAATAADDKIEESPSLQGRLKQLLVSRVQTAHKNRDALLAAYQARNVTFGEVMTAANALLTAELAVGKTPGQRVAAHKRDVEFCRQQEQNTEALVKAGVRGESVKRGTARYNRESAEIALVEACIAADQPYPTFDAAFELPARPDPFDP
jgi:hypothetical protein